MRSEAEIPGVASAPSSDHGDRGTATELEDAQRRRSRRAAPNDEATLRERARSLARRELEPEIRTEYAHLIVVRREDSLYGLPIDAVDEVRRIRLTHLPGAGGAIQGIFHLRGEIVSLVDLRCFTTTVVRPAHGEQLLAVVLSDGDRTIGIRIDEALGPRTIFTDELNPDAAGVANGVVTALTRDAVEIIDHNALFNHPDILWGA